MAESSISRVRSRDPNETRDDLELALSSPDKETYFFPKNVEEIGHWMVFRVQKHQLLARNDFAINHDVARIFMPVPMNLGTQYTQSYNSEGIGIAGAVGAVHGGDIANAVTGKGSVTSMLQRIRSEVDRKVLVNSAGYYNLQAAEEQLAPLVGAFIGGIPGAIAGAAAGQFLKGAVAGQGLARNPYMALMYDSPQFRTHQFSWKLIARNREETRSIREIIYLLKYHAAPGMNQTNPHFFKYPEQVDVDFHFDKYLFNIGPSVITTVEANYHAEGQPLYFDLAEERFDPEDDESFIQREAAPVSIELNVTIQEVAIVSKEAIEKQGR